MNSVETKQIGDDFLTRIDGTNAWFESTAIGKPIFNRGEVEVAKKLAKEFPDFEVQVTIGPYRFHDIAHEADLKQKLIKIDLYCVRPGIHYLQEIIEEIKAFIKKKQEEETKKTLKT